MFRDHFPVSRSTKIWSRFENPSFPVPTASSHQVFNDSPGRDSAAMSSVFGEQQVETQAIKPVEFEPPKCLDFFNKWRFCLSSSNQFHQYYIHGKFKDCTPYRKAMTSCMLYRSTKSQKAKECMIEVLKMDEIKFTSSSVWEKRENPADEWNK